MASSDSQINKPPRGRPKRAELPDVNINTGAQSINTERTSLINIMVLHGPSLGSLDIYIYIGIIYKIIYNKGVVLSWLVRVIYIHIYIYITKDRCKAPLTALAES